MTRASSARAPLRFLGRAGGAALALALARLVAVRRGRAGQSAPADGSRVPAARQPVLLINPRSGGGKAGRFRLVEDCRERGIEAVVLERGDDLARLAEDAVARGADVVGMASGDGSMGLVAGVLARHGVAMVVVPAGTRNHFAMDLGLDRRDVAGALDAFGPARERTIDLAEVDGRVFVNNVSLGLYAAIVRSPEYRDAKLETTLGALPQRIGPGSRPFDLRYTDPDGQQHTTAHMVQVSNNPYGRGPASLDSRPRLDGGVLGVIALQLPDAGAVTAFRRAAAADRPERAAGLRSWETSVFVVDAGGPIDVGIDGEAVTMTPPLRLKIRPGALRVRLPLSAPGLSPAARDLQAGPRPRSRPR